MQNTSIKKTDICAGFSEFCLTPEEDDKFMAGIDLEELIAGIEQSEKDISEGQVIGFEEAMEEIHKEVFGEEL